MNTPKYTFMLAAALAILPAKAIAAEVYTLDASHSQIVFSYDHLGYSTTYGMFSGFDGTIRFDKDNPAASSVEVSFPVRSMLTGWEERFAHFMSGDFFGASGDELVRFSSTGIEVTGENRALIRGDLSVNEPPRKRGGFRPTRTGCQCHVGAYGAKSR